jgi:hypothetical protein
LIARGRFNYWASFSKEMPEVAVLTAQFSAHFSRSEEDDPASNFAAIGDEKGGGRNSTINLISS